MTDPYFNVIGCHCIYCGKHFLKAKESKNHGKRNLKDVRNSNAVCCSSSCSRAYNTMRKNLR